MTRREFFQWSMRGVLAGLFFDAYAVEPKAIEWNEYELKPRGEDKDTLVRILQVSDLHLRTMEPHLFESIEEINRLKPHILCLTGDCVEYTKYLPVLDQYLNLIDRDILKFVILGNWEYWGGVDLIQLKRLYNRHRCKLLLNESVLCPIKNKSVLITGLDDYLGGDANIRKAADHYQKNDLHVVLNHCPEYRDFLIHQPQEYSPIDLVLAGHTHGGQINLFGIIPILPPGSGRYVKGWYKDAQPIMYVSRGVGTSSLPLRFLSPPEITMFNFYI